MPQSPPPSTPDRIRKALVTLGVPLQALVVFDVLLGLSAVVRDLTCTRVELVAENALLRQQLIVLRRQVRRPMLTAVDRWWMVMAARITRSWRDALMLVQPATLLRWHRERHRRWWAWKSSSKRPARPTIASDTSALIREMATANRLWGAERIRGELLKLGLRVCKRTVQKYMRRAPPRSPSGPRWGTFLRTHAQQIWACDFLQLHDAWFRPIFAFFIVEHASRRVVQVGVTRAPSDAWVAQQLRNATPNGEGPRFLLRDRDSKFGKHFDRAATGVGIRVIRTPVQAPRANAVCERFLGSVRRECLDHVLVLGDRHLEHVLAEYVRYFNAERPHQGLAQQIPTGAAKPANTNGRVVETPVLQGLHHAYRRAA
jgi:putative transposase